MGDYEDYNEENEDEEFVDDLLDTSNMASKALLVRATPYYRNYLEYDSKLKFFNADSVKGVESLRLLIGAKKKFDETDRVRILEALHDDDVSAPMLLRLATFMMKHCSRLKAFKTIDNYVSSIKCALENARGEVCKTQMNGTGGKEYAKVVCCYFKITTDSISLLITRKLPAAAAVRKARQQQGE